MTKTLHLSYQNYYCKIIFTMNKQLKKIHVTCSICLFKVQQYLYSAVQFVYSVVLSGTKVLITSFMRKNCLLLAGWRTLHIVYCTTRYIAHCSAHFLLHYTLYSTLHYTLYCNSTTYSTTHNTKLLKISLYTVLVGCLQV